jgi:hypothetical protein
MGGSPPGRAGTGGTPLWYTNPSRDEQEIFREKRIDDFQVMIDD